MCQAWRPSPFALGKASLFVVHLVLQLALFYWSLYPVSKSKATSATGNGNSSSKLCSWNHSGGVEVSVK